MWGTATSKSCTVLLIWCTCTWLHVHVEIIEQFFFQGLPTSYTHWTMCIMWFEITRESQEQKMGPFNPNIIEYPNNSKLQLNMYRHINYTNHIQCTCTCRSNNYYQFTKLRISIDSIVGLIVTQMSDCHTMNALYLSKCVEVTATTLYVMHYYWWLLSCLLVLCLMYNHLPLRGAAPVAVNQMKQSYMFMSCTCN